MSSNWVDGILDKVRLEEKDSKEPTGPVNKYEVRVTVEGTVLLTYVYAENVERARRVARKLFGKTSLKSPPKKV